MTATHTAKHYGETVVTSGRTVAGQVAETSKTSLLAAVGAGDLAVRTTAGLLGSLRSRAEALPGEAQVQADLALKEARDRAAVARATAHQVAGAVRPEALRGAVTDLVGTARTQVEALAERGAGVVGELRGTPGFRRVLRRTEQAVDTVEGAVEAALEETAEAVGEASDEVTSLAQKTASKAEKAADAAEGRTRSAAATTKATVREAGAPAPARRRTTTSAAKKAPAAATSARVTRARTAKRTDPTTVPARTTD